jgi:hypothetical protein
VLASTLKIRGRVGGRTRWRTIGRGYSNFGGAITTNLNARAVRLLRRKRRLRARLAVRLGDPSFLVGSEVTAVQRREATVTLRAR